MIGLALADLLDNSIFFLFLEVRLLLNLLLLFLGLASNFVLLFFQLPLKLLHLLLVLDLHDLLDDVGVADDTSLAHNLCRIDTLVEQSKLFSQLHNLILILSEQCILRVLVDLRLVLDALRATRIA